ncbi:acyltransferase family protein [Leifsonia sp. YIM 134122]|uniref:Acyltransferase family protein n=1 Tax=Leifsonia stereocauli TaxID=3134136 RepID=A0ABU9VZL7_9MICO
MRKEIQALRAIAVGAVVLFHLWPTRITGGFVGVDIFFAISGYLIIGHLLRETDASGGLALGRFWARRARRLLPASMLVLIATGVATVIWVPMTLWQQWFKEIGASAVYIQNWVLAVDSVDYLHSENSPSAVQHFWSLSVEEQLYIIWPLLIVAMLAIAARLGARPRRLIGITLFLLVLASFVYAAVAVATDPAPAYFVTLSRAWEFGAGGLLAFAAARVHMHSPRLRAAVSWVGFGMLVATIVLYSPATPFPGIAAVTPVLGTLLVIWAGDPRLPWGPGVLFRLRPVQWIGDISYSFYLWHWPLIVILPFALGHELGFTSRVGILVVSLALAWLSKTLIEDPGRQMRLFTARPAWLTLVATVAVTALMLGVSTFGYARTGQAIAVAAEENKRAVAAAEVCGGAVAVMPGNPCRDPYAPNILTNPIVAANDIGKGVQIADKCKVPLDSSRVITCDRGDVKAFTSTIALIGDSHAGQYLEALDRYGKQHHVRILTYIKTWCAGTGAPRVQPASDSSPTSIRSCATWGKHAITDIAGRPDIDSVVFTNYTSQYTMPSPDKLGRPVAPEDFENAWRPLFDAGKQVVAIRDLPNAGLTNIPQCIAEHPGDVDPCPLSRASATIPTDVDPLMIAATRHPEVRTVDLDDVFCDETTCHTLIGGLIVYFDSHHMTASFSRSIAPIIGPRVLGIEAQASRS